jgi:hypothetical protein
VPNKKRLISIIALLAGITALNAAPALASSDQEALFQDGPSLRSNPVGTLNTLRALGVGRLRLLMAWSSVAPSPGSRSAPRGFKSSDPAAYPARHWAIYDTIIKTAQADGIAVDLDLTNPAPTWATARGEPKGPPGVWKPSGSQFNGWVRAVGTRYSGHYKGLPRVSMWSVWNEPNYGPDLAPQARSGDTVELAPAEYRSLVDGAWSALHATGHGHDAFLIGETAPHGHDHPIGNFAGMRPLRFLRALYCVDSRFRQYRGSAAAARGCPTTAGGSRAFRAQHPGLFSASGFAAHLYAQGVPPNRSLQPNSSNADLAEVGQLVRTLDHLQSVYGSHNHLPIWNTEYGYQTNPPERGALNPTTAAGYMNWAEYISYRNSRIRSYAQYLLVDPPGGNFASGLLFSSGGAKPGYYAYRLPLYLPFTSTRKGRSLEVWGDVRPAHLTASPAQVAVQFRSGSRGAFVTVSQVTPPNRRGYFDVRVKFPASGQVRLAWRPPAGPVLTSRTVSISVH